MFQYVISLTEDDYIAFNEYYMTRTKQGRRMLWAIRLVAPLLSLLILLLLSIAEADHTYLATLAVGLTAFSVVWICVVMKMMLWSLRRSARRPKNRDKLYGRSAAITIDLTAGCLLEQTPQAEVKLPLTGIEQVGIGPTAYYFFIHPQQAVLLPYRFFSSQEEIQQLYNGLRAILGPDKVK